MEREDILKKISEGSDFSRMNLYDVDFSGLNLRGANFSFSDLTRANFTEANLDGANFEKARLQNTNFESARLDTANLLGAWARHANFSNAYLIRADLRFSNFDFATFKLHCSFGFAKTDKDQRQQLLAHAFSFFKHSELDEEERALFELGRKYVAGWFREKDFGKL
jgi:uncharacterized protein YjbI with pentapeptide repeats